MCDHGKNKLYHVAFTEEELRAIIAVFRELEQKSLDKWMDLLPENGERRSEACFKQWLVTGKLEEIKDKAASPLGLSRRVKICGGSDGASS